MQIGVGNYPLSIATADLNMDYTPEIVVPNWEVEGMRVIHNFLPVGEQTESSAYDINNDGLINFSDFLMLLSFLINENNYEIIGDFNFDYVVDIFDLIILFDNI